jgi:hypothetical protein
VHPHDEQLCNPARRGATASRAGFYGPVGSGMQMSHHTQQAEQFDHISMSSREFFNQPATSAIHSPHDHIASSILCSDS